MSFQRKRVVITGIGVVSPIGIGKEKYWQSLKSGQSGIKPITLFNTDGYNVNVAGEITEFDPARHFSKRALIDFNRATALLILSSKLAIEDSRIDINDENTDKTGVSVGTTFGSLHSLSEFDKESVLKGPQLVNPALFPNTVANLPASQVSIYFKIKGFNATVSTGMCSALDAIDYAIKAIQWHDRKMVVTGALEEMCEQTFLGFYKLKYLSGHKKNDAAISCPFDKRRNGIVFSEGSGSMILEDLSSAKERNADIYAEILSVASNFDPFRLNRYNPKGDGMVGSMKLALQKANLNPQDIDYICANANSTQDADLIEAEAIKGVFGRYCKNVPVSSIKSMVGDSYSAAGSLAAIASIGAMRDHFIPPNINCESIDPAIDLNLVIDKMEERNVRTVMINSFGQNGANACLIIRKYSS
jgi:3-oxoacyl-[acyl-carrier-protein] synthase II